MSEVTRETKVSSLPEDVQKLIGATLDRAYMERFVGMLSEGGSARNAQELLENRMEAMNGTLGDLEDVIDIDSIIENEAKKAGKPGVKPPTLEESVYRLAAEMGVARRESDTPEAVIRLISEKAREEWSSRVFAETIRNELKAANERLTEQLAEREADMLKLAEELASAAKARDEAIASIEALEESLAEAKSERDMNMYELVKSEAALNDRNLEIEGLKEMVSSLSVGKTETLREEKPVPWERMPTVPVAAERKPPTPSQDLERVTATQASQAHSRNVPTREGKAR